MSEYSCFRAVSGEDALVLLDLEPLAINLVICDYNLPGLNGVETIQRIRSLYPDTKFILFSGMDPLELARIATKAGIDCYLSKPFDAGVFCAWVNDILGIGTREVRPEATVIKVEKHGEGDMLQVVSEVEEPLTT